MGGDQIVIREYIREYCMGVAIATSEGIDARLELHLR